jgi:predicted acyltransferase (DUF342 family)
MNIITVNGKRIEVTGNNVVIQNGNVIVDGDLVSSGLSGEVKIKWEGELASLKCHNATIDGNVQGDVKAHNVKCRDVSGDVKAHNVTASTIKGRVKSRNLM